MNTAPRPTAGGELFNAHRTRALAIQAQSDMPLTIEEANVAASEQLASENGSRLRSFSLSTGNIANTSAWSSDSFVKYNSVLGWSLPRWNGPHAPAKPMIAALAATLMRWVMK